MPSLNYYKSLKVKKKFSGKHAKFVGLLENNVVKKCYGKEHSDIFEHEVYILKKLQPLKFIPQLLCIDQNKNIIYMSYCGQAVSNLSKYSSQIKQYQKIMADYFNIYHNDIRVGNVCINKKGQLFLIDFGWSREYKGTGGYGSGKIGHPKTDRPVTKQDLLFLIKRMFDDQMINEKYLPKVTSILDQEQFELLPQEIEPVTSSVQLNNQTNKNDELNEVINKMDKDIDEKIDNNNKILIDNNDQIDENKLEYDQDKKNQQEVDNTQKINKNIPSDNVEENNSDLNNDVVESDKKTVNEKLNEPENLEKEDNEVKQEEKKLSDLCQNIVENNEIEVGEIKKMLEDHQTSLEVPNKIQITLQKIVAIKNKQIKNHEPKLEQKNEFNDKNEQVYQGTMRKASIIMGGDNPYILGD